MLDSTLDGAFKEDDSDRWMKDAVLKTLEHEQYADEDSLETAIVGESKKLSDKLAEQLLTEMEKRRPGAIKEYLPGFTSRLYDLWGCALDYLQVEYEFAGWLAKMCLIRVSTDCEGTPHKVRAVAGLQARACRVTAEILRLISGGFAAGANARWRTLHEITVIASFLADRDDDVSQRYIDSYSLEQCKEVDEYQSHCDITGCEPYTSEDVRLNEKRRADLVEKYGDDFVKGDYGWAAKALGMKKPTFAKIVGETHFKAFRPDYKLSCRDIHGGASALFEDVGVRGDMPLLLLGPTNAGLETAGWKTAHSLAQNTSTILGLSPTSTSSAGLSALVQIARRAQNEFADAAEAFARYEAELDNGT